MTEAKITIIGGGSRQWAIGMLKDLTRQDKMLAHVCLYDINSKGSYDNEKVARKIFEINGHPEFTVCVETDIEKALAGSDFVVISIEPGKIECRYGDLVLPEQYGILQTVGDTTGPGGILRARRAVPLFMDFARKIEKCCPKAWVINYTNPMTWCTAALHRGFPGIKAIGCCHEVFGTENFLAEKCKDWYGATVDRREINIDASGVNHFTFMPKAEWNGHDLIARLKEDIKDPRVFEDRTEFASQMVKDQEWFKSQRVVALTFLRDYGVLGAAGDRHLSEFVPFYLTSEANIHRMGFLRTPYSYRLNKYNEKRAKVFTDDELVAKPNDEEGVDIILSLAGERTLHTNTNMVNKGQVPYLPNGRVVESMCDISKDSIVPVKAQPLTPEVESMVRRVSDEQDLVLTAIEKNDMDMLFEAFASDPLMWIDRTRARELFDKMLVASALEY